MSNIFGHGNQDGIPIAVVSTFVLEFYENDAAPLHVRLQ